jgi:hypothetical protein
MQIVAFYWMEKKMNEVKNIPAGSFSGLILENCIAGLQMLQLGGSEIGNGGCGDLDRGFWKIGEVLTKSLKYL